jgi:DNA-binding MarR family transcriptional regulator
LHAAKKTNKKFEEENKMENKELNLTEQFGRLMRLMMKKRLRGAKESMGKPDAWREMLLGMIKAHPGITEKELIKRIECRMHAGEELLLGLEKKGYIAFIPAQGSDDRTVALTMLGEKTAADHAGMGAAFGVLSEEEQALMQGFMARILAELEKGEKGDEAFDVPFMGWGMGGPERLRHLRAFFGGRGGCWPEGPNPRDGFGEV